MHRDLPARATAHDLGLLLLRVFAGLSLALAHGLGKLPPSERFVAGVGEMGFPAAPVFAWAAGLSETVGGLLLVVGLLTRPAAFFILATMVVAAFVRQAGDPFVERELALLYGFVATQFLLAGPGRLSLDALLRGRRAAAAPARAALLLAPLAAVVVAGCGGERPDAPPPEEGWKVAYVAPPGAVAARRGAELGAHEALRAGELVRRPFSLLTATATSPDEAKAAARALIREGAFAVVGGFDEASCRALDDLAAEEGVLFLNVGCREDRLRGERGPNTFHVQASEASYRRMRDSARAEPALWHAGLRRYGAAQLNERFERRFGQPPGADEWASWMAVKLLWESALRAESTRADALVAFLESGDAEFDGHKGQPLSFGADDHQLRQPLFPLPTATARPAPGGAGRAEAAAPSGEIPASGPLVLVSSEGSEDVAVVDAASHRLVARIPVGARPRGIHVSPDGERAYVALSDHAPTRESDRDAIVMIHLRSGRVAERYPAGTDPEQFALSPDGRRLYASNEDAGMASATDLRTREVIAQLPVGIEPEGVAVSPDGRWVYVTAETSNTVSVIDTRKNEVVASFLVDVRPRAVAFAPDGARAYVTNEISGTVSVVDARAHRVVATVELEAEGAKPVGVVVSPDGRRVYVANGHANSISVLDAGTGRVEATIPVGRRPWGIALSPDGRYVYTANGVSGDLSVVDTGTRRVVATVPVGERPWGVAVTP